MHVVLSVRLPVGVVRVHGTKRKLAPALVPLKPSKLLKTPET